MNDIHAVNWLGLWTLYTKEVRRFMKVGLQTVAAPIVTTLLFMAVFALALGRATQVVNGVPFMEFLAPGLIMMAIVQNAFANTSSSIMVSKVQGNIVDILMPPLTAHELTLAIVMGGATRGLVVGIAVAVAMSLFVTLHISAVPFVIFHAVAAACMMSLVGVMAGIWAEKFDHMAFVTNFIVTPLSFLSGTFYSISRLPELAQAIAHANPFFYMIDGFRYGFIGQSDSSVLTGVIVMVVVDAVLWLTCYRMLKRGYKLKA